MGGDSTRTRGVLSSRPGRRPRLFAAVGAVAAVLGSVLCAQPALAKTSTYLAGDQIRVNHYAQIESAKLGGLSLPGGVASFITLRESSLHTLPEVGPDGTVFPGAADTECLDAHGEQVGPAVHCTILVAVSPHVSNARDEPTKNLAVINATLDSDLAHEVFHCYQAVMAGTLANLNRPGDTWLVEGSATWVESDLVPGDAGAKEEWAHYLASPAVSLFKRTYTAIGFFSHLQSSGISPWSRFPAMFAATSNASAYNVSVGLSAAFLDSEASSFFRDAALGPEWDERGPDIPTPAEVGFKAAKLRLTSSAPVPLTAAPYTDGTYELSIERLPAKTPVLEVSSTGYVRLRTTHGGVVNVLDPAGLMLCSDPKGCDCPSQPHPEYKAFEQGDLALTGGPGGSSADLTPRKRCEELLAARKCATLLPQFSAEPGATIERLIGKPTSAESSRPGGYTSSICSLLSEGTVQTNAEGEEFLEGAFIPLLEVTRSGTVAGAIAGFEVSRRVAPGAATVRGIGDEAWIALAPPSPSPSGQVLFGATAAVRVHNIDVSLSITGNEADAGAGAVRLLLAQIAGEL
ncbi:MAG TPA: hypothetical protein VGY13_05550 [Solirubrobacteraceae bacterium]|nr:hypothetical protein [Solirubrobacteraceae bacterium]